MGSFFRVLRRKAGYMAAAVTILTIIGSIRSQFIGDSFRVDISGNTGVGLVSEVGSLSWLVYRETAVGSFPTIPQWSSSRDDLSPTTDRESFQWTWRFKRFGYGQTQIDDGQTLSVLSMPYWFLTLPMILLAYLFLSEPQKEKPKSATEPSLPE